jgi:hypothetical protein
VAALSNLRRFHAEGGSLVALGGVPFCHPCVQDCEAGRWVDKIDELGTGTERRPFPTADDPNITEMSRQNSLLLRLSSVVPLKDETDL